MSYDPQPFRARYRAAIHPRYNVWLHGGFVLLFGIAAIGFFWSRATDVQPLQWLTVPLALVCYNGIEYVTHRYLGHHRRAWARMFYQRHTGDHHSFFADGQMTFESLRDWRVILFPAWLIVVATVVMLLGWLLLEALNRNVVSLFFGGLLIGYLGYEVLHACEHFPDDHPVSRLLWVRHMRKHHAVHHRRDLMQTVNFNVTFPLWDWVLGTLYRESPAVVRVQNHVEIGRRPEQVLDYVRTVTRWHEWHPYPVTTTGPAGPVPAGCSFEYDSSRAGRLSWDVVDHVPQRSWKARARGKYGLELLVTYECLEVDSGTRFVRTLEYHFASPIGRLADRLFARRRIKRDSLDLLDKLRRVASEAIPG